MKTELELNNQKLTLFRFPKRKKELLQAWNAADEYLISEISQLFSQLSNHPASHPESQQVSRVLILNDSFGALCCALSSTPGKRHIFHCGDSFLSQQAIQSNLVENNLAKDSIESIHPMADLPTDIDLVILKLPKSQALLEYQLIKIAQHLKTGIKIIAAAMTKDIHNSTIKLFEKIMGSTKTSLAKKKARLIFSTLMRNPVVNPYPKFWELELENKIFKIENNANLFSLNSLDLGARFMIENLLPGNFENVIDLGCGNGVLGLVAASNYPNAKIRFVDESYMAINSAKNNWQYNFPQRKLSADFLVMDCLQRIPNNEADLILCNPPFHQQQAITDHIALQMFTESARVLNKNGRLLVIGNRHLGYHLKLKKWFGTVEQIAANSKFVIFAASN